MDALGLYNMSLQASSWDGSAYGERVALVQAMMVRTLTIVILLHQWGPMCLADFFMRSGIGNQLVVQARVFLACGGAALLLFSHSNFPYSVGFSDVMGRSLHRSACSLC